MKPRFVDYVAIAIIFSHTAFGQREPELTNKQAAVMSGDRDHDGVPDNQDNCPYLANPSQADNLGDGIGDACRSIEKAKNDYARRLQVNAAVAGIYVELVQHRTWRDSCLGLSRPEEHCKAKHVPGYRVVFAVSTRPGVRAVYHTGPELCFRYAGALTQAKP